MTQKQDEKQEARSKKQHHKPKRKTQDAINHARKQEGNIYVVVVAQALCPARGQAPLPRALRTAICGLCDLLALRTFAAAPAGRSRVGSRRVRMDPACIRHWSAVRGRCDDAQTSTGSWWINIQLCFSGQTYKIDFLNADTTFMDLKYSIRWHHAIGYDAWIQKLCLPQNPAKELIDWDYVFEEIGCGETLLLSLAVPSDMTDWTVYVEFKEHRRKMGLYVGDPMEMD